MSTNHEVRRPSPGEPVRVRVVADDPLVRETLTRSLAAEKGIALEADAAAAHVALFDPGPLASGPQDHAARTRFEAVLTRVSQLGAPAVVLLHDESQARAALSRGARGAVQRSTDGPRLVAALGAVAAGLTVVDVALSRPLPAKSEDEVPVALTPREREVLELLAAGCSNRRIARRLAISEHTAKFHVNAILLKLDAGSRTEAVVNAARRGLVML